MTAPIHRSSRRKRPRFASTWLLIVAVTATVGCSTVMHPRVPYPGAFETDDQGREKTTCKFEHWNTVKGSLGCATVARHDMEVRAGQQATIPRVIGAVLIPLTAAIAGLAMTGTTGAPVTALTLAGVTTMGEGLWLSSPARRQAYSVGASAVQCVITTTRPLAFVESPGFTPFEKNVTKLTSKILDVNRRIAAVTTALANLPAPPPPDEQAAIDEELAVAHRIIANAKLVQARAETLIARMNGAAEEIHSGVDRIIRLVNEEIDKAEPTMEMVRQAVSQQIQMQTSAIKGLDALIEESAKKAAAADAKRKQSASGGRETRRAVARKAAESPQEKLDEARADLLTELLGPEGLNIVVIAVSNVLDRVGNPASSEACVTTAQGSVGAKPLEITLATDDAVAPGQTVVFLVSGGVGDVQIKADADAQAALDVQQNTVSGVKQVAVKVKADAKPGTYLVDVTDSQSTKVVKIVVKSAPPPPLKVSGGIDTLSAPAVGTVVTFAATGSGTCTATLTPLTGFRPLTAAASDGICVITLVWAGPLPAAAQSYKLEVTFGPSKGSRDFKVTP